MSNPAHTKKPYKVGPGFPPPEHQWPKGTSGNPKGRPPKKQKEKLSVLADPLTQMIVSHGDKKLPVPVGGDIQKISAIEAALNKLFKMGMEGHSPSLRLYLEIQAEAQRSLHAANDEFTMAAIIWRNRYLEQFLESDRLNKPLPDILPDPRDIIFDETGMARIVGPVNYQDKLEMDSIVEHQETVLTCLDDLASNSRKADILEKEIRRLKRRLTKCNAALPPRLRKLWQRAPHKDHQSTN
ncbi:hypothetical protein SAMN02745824_1752 [Parasphingorhabdus marina DSM 22363]|uniref:DUF5681 domain-containing protein n=1 Tax=Parasphingorhabdus marina DSM 22363 TaxID=1123272 RepID=A0A1N6DAB3_9SPHN|nr:DUF5681 domain-containing protein [Parasphingorhabdus marina]SIN67719.1 hypothetical protein SAMN02745824_1752 [Parasphingorhabdus marina DSM 22363]